MWRQIVNGGLCVALATLSAKPALADDKVVRLKPSSKWNAVYNDDSCRLMRSFGPKDSLVGLVIDQFAPGQQFKLSLVGKPVTRLAQGDKFEFAFGPSEAAQKTSFFLGDYGKDLPAVILRGSVRVAPFTEEELKRISNNSDAFSYRPSAIGPDRLAAVKQLALGKPGGRQIVLETGAMKAPFAALDTCLKELVGRWGVDFERYQTARSGPRPTKAPGSWVKNTDYPDKAFQMGKQGIVNFRLSVDASGVPTACHIQQSSRGKDFDEATCKIMMRSARFSPAIDAKGVPMESFYRHTIVFSFN